MHLQLTTFRSILTRICCNSARVKRRSAYNIRIYALHAVYNQFSLVVTQSKVTYTTLGTINPDQLQGHRYYVITFSLITITLQERNVREKIKK